MTPRATAMTPDDRRKAIVSVLVPLIAEHGGDVSIKEIAQAAGIAEGTIFRVFPDKRSLMLAAAEEAINPADGQRDFEEAIAGLATLGEKVVVVAERVQQRMHLTMSVMIATRSHLMAAHDHAKASERKPGPPPFVIRAQADLNQRLTGLFEAHRDELAVKPDVAAAALRSLIFGAGRFELGLGPSLTPTQIADLVLNGVVRRKS